MMTEGCFEDHLGQWVGPGDHVIWGTVFNGHVAFQVGELMSFDQSHARIRRHNHHSGSSITISVRRDSVIGLVPEQVALYKLMR